MKGMLPVLFVVLLVMTPYTPASTAPATPNRLTIATLFAPTNAWALETDDAFVLARAGVCEMLVRVDFDGKVVPSLAESWRRVDGTTWEFKLRPGVTFHNGEPLTTQAVAGALDRIRKVPTLPRGFRADTMTAVQAVGDRTLTIQTGSPDALLPTRLSSPNMCILAPSAYRAGGLPSPVGTGTGPFVLKDVGRDSIKVIRSRNYWGGAVALEETTTLFVPDAGVRGGMVQTGEADVVTHVAIPQVPLLERDAKVTVVKVLQPRTVALYLNNSRPPFSDVRVRRAVQHAIDKKAIVTAVLEGIGQSAVGPFPTAERAWANAALKGYAYDPQRARTLLAEAGYRPGDLKLALWAYPARAEFVPMAEAVQKMLRDVGVVVDVRVAPYETLAPDVLAGRYDMFLLSRGHLVDVYDPEGFLTADYTCRGTFNLSNYCNPILDALLAQARTKNAAEARYNIYRQVQSILDDDAVSVFINHTVQIFAYNKKVQNYAPHLLEHYVLTPRLAVAK
jgi:peptide/nickel transport system substrate-binding protein